MPATTSSDGNTSLRVIVRRLSRAFCSAGVCDRVWQLAFRTNGSDATATRATPTKIRSKSGLDIFKIALPIRRRRSATSAQFITPKAFANRSPGLERQRKQWDSIKTEELNPERVRQLPN